MSCMCLLYDLSETGGIKKAAEPFAKGPAADSCKGECSSGQVLKTSCAVSLQSGVLSEDLVDCKDHLSEKFYAVHIVINDDELVEVVPDDIRLRKKILNELERKRSGRVYDPVTKTVRYNNN